MWVNNKNGVLNISRSDNYVVITFTNYARLATYKKIDIDKITDALKLYNTRYDIMIESYLLIFLLTGISMIFCLDYNTFDQS